MDTKSEINVRDSLIACGQFTMCYNLLEYILQIEAKFPEVTEDAAIQQLKRDILNDWQMFQTAPGFMIVDFNKAVG